MKPFVKIDKKDATLAMAHIYVGFAALALGGLAGLLQVLVRSGRFTLPAGIGYYQVLTVHGVLLGLVLTTFFILGFQHAAISRTSGTYSGKSRFMGWLGFWVMLLGTIMAAVMILLNEATVLYTFYAPLQAHWIFYLGLTFVVVGSWLGGSGMIMHEIYELEKRTSWTTESFVNLHEHHQHRLMDCCHYRRCRNCSISAPPLVPWPGGQGRRSCQSYLVLVFRTSTRLFLAAAGIYGMVCDHSENHWRKNIFRFIGTTILYPFPSVLDTGRFSPSIGGAGN